MEILNDFLVRKGDAYYCKYADFYIDPLYPVARAVISHAHGDHASAGHGSSFLTEATASFMKLRFPKYAVQYYKIQDFGAKFMIGEVQLTFIPAGHILGSAQILMEYRGVRYLYTGDYKVQKDATCEPIQYVHTDVLITETTFANPDISHPDPVMEIKKLNDVSSNVLLGCYVLGKAQRITSLINNYCADREVLVHHKIAPLHRIYEQVGGIPLRYKIYNRRDMKDGQKNKIYLVPPMTFNSYYRAKDVQRAFASGWERLQRHNDLSLYISDHVDWNDLLGFVDEVKPQQIWTIHGDGRYLEKHFDGQIFVRNIMHVPESLLG